MNNFFLQNNVTTAKSCSMTILDLSCGSGFMTRNFLKTKRYLLLSRLAILSFVILYIFPFLSESFFFPSSFLLFLIFYLVMSESLRRICLSRCFSRPRIGASLRSSLLQSSSAVTRLNFPSSLPLWTPSTQAQQCTAGRESAKPSRSLRPLEFIYFK